PLPHTAMGPPLSSHAASVQAQFPSEHEHVLQPSSAGFTSPSTQSPHVNLVQYHSPPSHAHVLQPSPASLLSPSSHVSLPDDSSPIVFASQAAAAAPNSAPASSRLRWNLSADLND